MFKEALRTGVNPLEIKENPLSNGIALGVVGIDPSRNGENATQPELWTIKEKKSKPSTGKIAGQISLPGETRKIGGEPIRDLIGGALAELTDNNFIIANNLFFMSDSSHVQGKLFVNGNPFDIVVLMYEGPLDRSFSPFDKEEVSENGWMTMEEIKKVNQSMVRGFVWDFLSLEQSEGFIQRTVSDYLHSPMKRIPLSRILPSNFSSIERFYKQREKLEDIVRH